jgi:hypothetical protein
MPSEKVYLGDGVYVENQGGMLRLSTVRRGGLDEHYIFLDPATWAALVAYEARERKKERTNA